MEGVREPYADSLKAGDNQLLGPRKEPEFPEAVVISDVVIIKGGAYLEPLLLEGTLPHTCCPEMDAPYHISCQNLPEKPTC